MRGSLGCRLPGVLLSVVLGERSIVSASEKIIVKKAAEIRRGLRVYE